MALTDVDYCEANPQVAQMFNAESVDHIVAELEPDATFAYLSSDQVYLGDGVPMQRTLLIPSTSMVRASYPVNWRRFDMRIHFAFGPPRPSRTEGRASLSDFVVEALRQESQLLFFRIFCSRCCIWIRWPLRATLDRGRTARRLQSWLPRG